MTLFRNRRARETETFEHIAGERDAGTIARALSLQARLSNFAVVGVAIAFGVALLFWYYVHAVTRTTHARESTQSRLTNRVSDDAALPPIGSIQSSAMPRPLESVATRESGDEPGAERPDSQVVVPSPGTGATPVLEEARGSAATTRADTQSSGPTALQRRLSGDPFSQTPGVELTSTQLSAPGATSEGFATVPTRGAPNAGLVGSGTSADAGTDAHLGTLSAFLVDQPTPAVEAHLLPTQSLLLPKGSFIDCTLETAIDSTLPGMTTCVTATDTFSADGHVVLLERGTKLVGETRGQVQQGAARVFVLWTEARTPTGVAVPLDSPAADELGRSGLTGNVDRHFWERFGAAVLISVIDGAVQAGVQSSAGRGGTVIYSPGGAQDVMSEVLKGTLAIPPTVVKNNGDRVQVLVARDVDFRKVYELRNTSASP